MTCRFWTRFSARLQGARRSSIQGRFLAILLVVLLPSRILAESTEEPQAPPFHHLRYNERYDYLATPEAPRDFFDPIKYIPLFGLPDSYLSVGGEIRLRYEYTNNPEWGQAPQDEHGVFLQRYVLHTDLHITRYFRAFGQLRSALSDGRAGGPSPVEEGELDVQQLFGDLVFPLGRSAEAIIRGGRQEIRLGSERLVSVSEGLNIRRRFDAVRTFALLPGWNMTALAAYLTENKEGTFNDGFNTDTALWGAYAVRNLAFGTPLNVDLYYLGLDDENAAYEQGLGSETRHTIGTRLWGRTNAWDWNWEFAYQFGTFNGADIIAWTVATDTGYTFAKLPWTPRFAFNANVASGDRDAEDPSLQTFNPLFPRGNYFSHLAMLGPRNFFNVHPRIEFSVHAKVKLSACFNFFWRLSTEDGIYGPGGQLLRAGVGSEERYVGTLISAESGWQANRHLFLGLVYTHVFPGSFIKDTGPSEDIDFVELTARFLF